ncbi:MAG: isoleucine--tRNA ligase [Thermaerobacterales bacterium]
MSDKTSVDYRSTLNLPKTDFPMRASLPAREPEIQDLWAEKGLYDRLRLLRAGRERFVLHDGPPYANGEIHMGTALNKVLKDIVVRYASMRGYDAPFIPGWDTHGLPIEHRAIAELGIDRKSVSAVDLRRRCAEFARHFIGVMTGQFQRLGVMADWDNPYITLNPAYEAEQIRVFGAMAERGYIYKGLKSVYWCADCETAMAEAEIEYHEKESPSIFVAFPFGDTQGKLPPGSRIAIWTTTPWTIPANTGIAVHPDVTYTLVDTDDGPLMLAEELREKVLAGCGIKQGAVLGRFQGKELEGLICRHPLFARDSLVILGGHVTTEDGTGAVHTAPGHGQDDFEIGRQYDLPVIVPIDDRGHFTEEAGPFAGRFYEGANEAIIEALDTAGALLGRDQIEHQYAHCWRCKNPVLWRATQQWFASVAGFREQALEAIRDVQWLPSWGALRISNMVTDRADWCISRQRVWGVPIPAFYCEDCDHIMISETIEAVSDLFRREGSNAWFERPAAEIVPAGTVCSECGGGRFRKETDTMDVWFDSGSSHATVLEQHPELHWPADLYLEGSDQHRGWFQSSLLTAVATRGAAPYKSVVTHGFVVDGDGRKMSKSLGNGIDPFEIIQKYGADILRLWVASVDYTMDVRLSPEILGQMADVYRKIRNTLRFILGNLSGFDPDRDEVPFAELEELDRWLLAKSLGLAERVTASYDQHQYHQVYQAVHNFCVIELSSFYLDVVKDRLYAEPAGSAARRGAQTVLWHAGGLLARVIAPVLVHSAEEVWRHLPQKGQPIDSVHLAPWPELPAEWDAPELLRRWSTLLTVRDEAARTVEAAKGRGEIKDGGSSSVTLAVDPGNDGLKDLLQPFAGQLPGLFRVAAVSVTGDAAPTAAGTVTAAGLGLKITVAPAQYRRCDRCWRHTPDVGADESRPDVCSRCARVLISGIQHG